MHLPTRPRLALAVVLLAGLAVGPQVAAAKDAQALPAAKLPAIAVTRAEKREIAETTVVSGTLVPRLEVLVPAEIDGYAIIELLAEEGDTVKEGQVLARLQRQTLDAQLQQNTAQIARIDALTAQAKAQITEAEANVVESTRSLARTKTLRETGTATVEKLDQRVSAATSATARLASAQQTLMVAQADRQAAEAQRRELEIRIARTEIKAPRAGLISRRNAKIGAIAALAGEPLFRIIADAKVELEAEVPDVNLPRLVIGQKVLITPAGHSEPLEGKVRLISPEVDKSSRLGRIRVEVSAPQPLPIGAFARGVIELGRRTGPTVPQSAVTFGKEGPSVLVVENNIVKTRSIVLGLSGTNRIEVTKGLVEDELVVVRAGTFLREGDRVLPKLEEAKP